MANLNLFCLVDGESTSKAFPVSVPSTETIGHLKELIKAELAPEFDDIAGKEITLWSVSIQDADDDDEDLPILLDNIPNKERTKLRATRELSVTFKETPAKRMIHIIVQRPPQTPKRDREEDEQVDLPNNKKIRITEGWKQYTASDGKVVDLPPPWIDMLVSSEFEPEPRAVFNHLRNDLRAGDAIIIPSMGQNPKDFGRYSRSQTLFVTEQMLELWEDMRGDKERTYRQVLSGPMGVGKSYLSYFLAARAYAEGWLVLYVSDAGVLDQKKEDESELAVVKLFLALNKDILTGAELEKLVNDYNGKYSISTEAVSAIFGNLLKSRDRKTLLLVDEHGKLFEKEPYVPDKFKSLVPLSSYHWWGEDAKGSRVIFTGTAHAKYEMTILDDSYRPTSVVFVGPLSRNVFTKLVDTYPRLRALYIKGEVIKITNCVPRELVLLAASFEGLQHSITGKDLEKWTEGRMEYFFSTAQMYYDSCNQERKEEFREALQDTFLGTTSTVYFDWDVIDLGIIYRSKDVSEIGTKHHILCRPAQRALLKLFRSLPLPEDIRRRIRVGDLRGDDFKLALCHQLICAHKPILLRATDLNGKNPTTITLDFPDSTTILLGQTSPGPHQHNYLTRGCPGYPRFDLMLGLMFIRVSISDFGTHNTGAANLKLAFEKKDAGGRNQIENYLDDMFGPRHSAKIHKNKFVVTRNNVPLPDFCVVYIRGSPGKPTHRDLVKSFPDVRHVAFEDLKDSLFKCTV